jgi:hypothetical protein
MKGQASISGLWAVAAALWRNFGHAPLRWNGMKINSWFAKSFRDSP